MPAVTIATDGHFSLIASEFLAGDAGGEAGIGA
jgi:hypothetical protein